MKAQYINAFLTPCAQVLQKMGKVEVTLGPLQRMDEHRMDGNVSILIGLQGRLSGHVLLSASKQVALALAERVAGEPLGDEPAAEMRTILAELANTIVGNATGHLYDLGIREGITPPTVVEGGAVNFDFGASVESVLVPLETDVGPLVMIVSLVKEDL